MNCLTRTVIIRNRLITSCPWHPSDSPVIHNVTEAKGQRSPTGVDCAISILTVINAVSDLFPPLKAATGGALFILDEVKMFREAFGTYIVRTMADVVTAVDSYDASSEEGKPWIESEALQRIKTKTKISQLLRKMGKRPAAINFISHMSNLGMISDLRKDLCEDEPDHWCYCKYSSRNRECLSSERPVDRISIDLSDGANVDDCATYIRMQLRKLKDVHPSLRDGLGEEDKLIQNILE
ncbi:uncharacterized protein EI90DRAFT_2711924 [Cantharellus anzutake]|uniref:uncharacterized protein n=1 Tax=Cantharellus anzutake TaxID=1750568 RepID=UPI0019077466|nr:uncharacterized protein EI90DRAFT_2711924 [Cantharellus anzutake]KAF8318346.1 hypothetical protein EI90DRAFT_2711924 [Cantharellus anzutake]